MNSPRPRESAIFKAALELPPAERAALLDRECSGDPQLRAKIEALLDAREATDGAMLNAPVPGGTIALPPPPPEAGIPSGTIALPPVPSGTIALGAPVTVAPVTLPAEEYAVGGEIARGGMGSILEAEDRKLGRKVAMKVMKLEASASEYARTRFVREATVLARLEHPNIVPIHELGWDAENRLFYTMKLVQGRTLQAVINGLKERDPNFIAHYTLDRLLTIFRKICDALSLAHSRGVIHRDLKPENVMVGEFGEVLVMDWGIAKILGDTGLVAEESAQKAEATVAGTAGKFRELADEELRKGSAELTLDGTVMGTPHYMSPEQADGRVTEIDQQSDVFSLGAILYALITLHTPVEADSPYEVLELIKRGEIRPPTDYNVTTKTGGKGQSLQGAAVDPKRYQPLPHCPGGKVPPALSAVTMRALTVDKARRYPTVAAFAADIEKYQSGFATSAEEASLFTQLRLLVQRHKREFAVGFVGWLVITALAVWFVINLRAKEQRARLSEEKALTEKEAARRSAARASLSLADTAMREANSLAMQAALNEVPPDLRDGTWSYLLARSDTSIARLLPDGEAIEGAAADPTRPGVFALADRSGKVTVMNVRTGERLLEFQLGFAKASGSFRYRLAFSPDGQHIAAGRARAVRGAAGPGGLVLHRAKDGTKEKELETPQTDYLEFGREDALLRYGNKNLQVWNPITGRQRWEEKQNNNIGVKATFTPDGNEIVTFTAADRLRLRRMNDGSVSRELGGRKSRYDWFMAVRPDGKAVVTWNETQITECISLEDGQVLFALSDKKRRQHMGFSRDSTLLFTAAVRTDGLQAIEVWNAQTGEPISSVLGGQGSITALGLHPLSGELIVAGASSRAWDATGPGVRWRMASVPGGSFAFWGPEDWVFGFVGNRANWGLHRLRPDGLERLWQDDRGSTLAETSADGSLAVVGRPQGNEINLFRKEGAKVERVNSFTAKIQAYRFRPSPKGSRVLLMERVTGLGVRLYDTAGKESVKLEHANASRITEIRWLNEQRLLGLLTFQAARGNPGSRENIVLWDAGNGKVIHTVTHPTAMDALAVAPDGRRFAEAGADKLVRIRDSATLAIQKEFRAHDAPITVLAWHPTQPVVATGSEDLSVKIWNFESGRLLAEFRSLLHAPDHIVFSPTGRILGCRTRGDLIVSLWPLDDAPAMTPR